MKISQGVLNVGMDTLRDVGNSDAETIVRCVFSGMLQELLYEAGYSPTPHPDFPKVEKRLPAKCRGHGE